MVATWRVICVSLAAFCVVPCFGADGLRSTTKRKAEKENTLPQTTQRLDRDEEDILSVLFNDFDTPALSSIQTSSPAPQSMFASMMRFDTNIDGADIVYDGEQSRFVVKAPLFSVATDLSVPSNIFPRVHSISEITTDTVTLHLGDNAAWSVAAGRWLSTVLIFNESLKTAATMVQALISTFIDKLGKMKKAGYGLSKKFDFIKGVSVDSLTGKIAITALFSVQKWSAQCYSIIDFDLSVMKVLKNFGDYGLAVYRVLNFGDHFHGPMNFLMTLGRNTLIADVDMFAVNSSRIEIDGITCTARFAILPYDESYRALSLDKGGAVLVLEFLTEYQQYDQKVRKHLMEALSLQHVSSTMRFVTASIVPVSDGYFRVGLIFGIRSDLVPLSAVTEDLSERAIEIVCQIVKTLSLMRLSGGANWGLLSPSTIVFARDTKYEKARALSWTFNSVSPKDLPKYDPSIALSLQTWRNAGIFKDDMVDINIASDLRSLAAVYCLLRRHPISFWRVVDTEKGVMLKSFIASDGPFDDVELPAGFVLARHHNVALAVPLSDAFNNLDYEIIDSLRKRNIERLKELAGSARTPKIGVTIDDPLRSLSMGVLAENVERVFDIDREAIVSFGNQMGWAAKHKLTGAPVIVVPYTQGNADELFALAYGRGVTVDGPLPPNATELQSAVSSRVLQLRVANRIPRLLVPIGIFVLHSASAVISWSVYKDGIYTSLSSVQPITLEVFSRMATQLCATFYALAQMNAIVGEVQAGDIYLRPNAEGVYDFLLATLSRASDTTEPLEAACLRSSMALSAFLKSVIEHYMAAGERHDAHLLIDTIISRDLLKQ